MCTHRSFIPSHQVPQATISSDDNVQLYYSVINFQSFHRFLSLLKKGNTRSQKAKEPPSTQTQILTLSAKRKTIQPEDCVL
jgi:hypothetical protein